MRINQAIGAGVLLLCSLGYRSYAAETSVKSNHLNLKHFFQEPVVQDTTKKQLTITGIVVDEGSLPVPGVSVKSASGKSAATDAAGKFTIGVTGATENLTFTYIGYNPVTRAAGSGNAPLSIRLEPSSTTLKDVQIVAVGYGTQTIREVTSSVAHVGTEDFRQSGARNPLDLAQGKVAGLQLSRPGGSNPNSAVGVQLRGAVSTDGSASPLYVIDGIPGGNPDLLQQDDIASIDVLKDGSGAAIYGTSANAGVILITTKRGKPGAPRFDYSSYVRKEYLQNKPDFLSPEEFRQKLASGELRNQEDRGSSTDFFGGLINKGNVSHNHNLALSGGTEQTSYRGALNYRNLQGISKENGREEYTLRFALNQKAFDNKLNLQMNLVTNVNKANLLGGGGWESEIAKNPTLSNYNPDGSFRYDLTSTNEFARLSMETNYRKQQTSSADIKADLEIFSGLKGSIFGSVTRDSRDDSQYRFKGSEDSMENTDYPSGGYAYKGSFLSQKYAFEPTLNYQKKFAEKHDITAVLGYSYRYDMEESSNMSNRGFVNDSFHEDLIQSGAALRDGKATMESYRVDNTLIAFFGRVNYALNNKYLLQFILRREGSSRFGKNNRWGNFPGSFCWMEHI